MFLFEPSLLETDVGAVGMGRVRARRGGRVGRGRELYLIHTIQLKEKEIWDGWIDLAFNKWCFTIADHVKWQRQYVLAI